MTSARVLPGDVILYPATGRSALSSRLVIAGEIIAGMGAGIEEYSHAAIVASTPGCQFEATFPFTCRSAIDVSRPYEIWRLGEPTQEQRRKILSWCGTHLGDLYNLTGVLSFGYINLPNTYYCSQFACLAYAAADLHPGDRIMSPDSIPLYPGARMIDRGGADARQR